MFFVDSKRFKKSVGFFNKITRGCPVVKTPSGCQCNPTMMGKWWVPCYFSLQFRIPHNKLTRIEWFMHWNSETDFGLKLSAKSVQNLRPCHMEMGRYSFKSWIQGYWLQIGYLVLSRYFGAVMNRIVSVVKWGLNTASYNINKLRMFLVL